MCQLIIQTKFSNGEVNVEKKMEINMSYYLKNFSKLIQ